MTSFRDARRIQPHREVTVTGRRVAALVAVQALVAGGAFAGGYLLRGDTVRVVAPARTAALDPLRALDAEDKRVDFTYHRELTEPRERESAPAAVNESPSYAGRSVASRAPAAAPAPRRVVAARTRASTKREPALRVVAEGPRKEDSSDEGGSDEVRKLDEHVRNLAASSARTKAAKKAAARFASTDDELSEAMDPASPGRARRED